MFQTKRESKFKVNIFWEKKTVKNVQSIANKFRDFTFVFKVR